MDEGKGTDETPPRGHIIKRPRLMKLLDESQARVIMLVAPAGYGKTTLARQWLDEHAITAGWYRVSAESRDTAGFVLGVARAVEAVVPGASVRVRQSLRTVRADTAVEDLADILAEDISPWPLDSGLVLDDYQFASAAPSAETFLDLLVRNAEIPTLIMSRVRPSWASARRLLYGELHELGATVLAMTQDEAVQVLGSSRSTEELPGLVALAEGWPAIIGLAALASGPIRPRSGSVPQALHTYFAQELYDTASQALQRRLCVLTIPSLLSTDLAVALFGKEGKRTLASASQLGFITREHDGFRQIHPLLRVFLSSKLSELDQAELLATRRLIAAFLLRTEQWDQAYEVISTFEASDLLIHLVTRGLDRMLTEGRLATLTEWVAVARAHGSQDSILALTEAEVAFREGRWHEAERLALGVAEALSPGDPLLSRAYFRAGQSAHLNERRAAALRMHEKAQRSAITHMDIRQALWGKFVTLDELEDVSAAEEALRAFELLPAPNSEDLLRRFQARLSMAWRSGNLQDALSRAGGWHSLLELQTDPLIRASFLQTLGTSLSLCARYEDALGVAENSLANATRSRLGFVNPHALAVKGSALLGLRRFAQARKSLDDAFRLGQSDGDLHAQMNAVATTARLDLAQGKSERAVDIMSASWPSEPSKGMLADYFSTQALALACCGRTKEAFALASRSMRLTNQAEGRILGAFAKAIAAISDERPSARRLTVLAFREALDRGNYDGFVCSYRAFPALLDYVKTFGEQSVLLDGIIRDADPRFAQKLGINIRPIGGTGGPLTPRETEVLSLVRHGMSNREIARALWIAEPTVKVHVRQVLTKLGVRSRVEAAVAELD